MKCAYTAVLLCLLLTACNSTTIIPTQPSIGAKATDTVPALPTPVFPTATFDPTPTEGAPPILPSPPTAKAMFFMRIGEPLKLSSIYMIDEQNGWALDESDPLNHIFHTHDGGLTWKDVSPYYGYGTPIYYSGGFFALDANTAWATTPEMPACYIENFNCTLVPDTALIWHTTDGGITWQGQFVTSLPWGYIPMSIQFIDAQTGWLLVMSFTNGKLHYQLHQTTDGGFHWSQIMKVSSRATPDDSQEKNITAIAFQNEQKAWMSTSEICCEAHLIKEWKMYRSIDAGATWESFPLPAPDPLPETFLQNPAQCAVQNIHATPPGILDATVSCYVYEGLTKPEFTFHYHSVDGGDHWISFQKTGDVQFLDALLGWRMTANEGAYDLERTQDGGITWATLKTVQWNGSLHFVNKFVGWALARSSEGVALVHTVDGGRTWDVISPVVTAK